MFFVAFFPINSLTWTRGSGSSNSANTDPDPDPKPCISQKLLTAFRRLVRKCATIDKVWMKRAR